MGGRKQRKTKKLQIDCYYLEKRSRNKERKKYQER